MATRKPAAKSTIREVVSKVVKPVKNVTASDNQKGKTTKPVSSKPPPPVKTPEQQAAEAAAAKEQKDSRAIQGLIGKDSQGATALSNRFFPEGSLGRVSTGFDAQGNRIQENQDILDREKATAQAYGIGGVARRSADVQEGIDRSRGNLTRSAETTDSLNRLKEGLGRKGETQDYLNMLQAKTGRSGETQSALDAQRASVGISNDEQQSLSQLQQASQRSPENQALLDQAKSRYGATSEENDYLNRLNSATSGYSSAENQAAYEQSLRGVNDAYRNNSAELARKGGNLGVRGGILASLAAKNEKGLSQAQAQAAQDIFIKNADEKQARLLKYGQGLDTVNKAQQGRFVDSSRINSDISQQEGTNRLAYSTGAMGVQNAVNARGSTYGQALRDVNSADQSRTLNLGSALDSAQKSEAANNENYNTAIGAAEATDRQNLANYNSNVSGAETNEYNKGNETNTLYNNTLQGMRSDELTRQQDNLDNVAGENSGRAGAFFGGLGVAQQNKASDQQNKFSQQYLDLARQQFGASRKSKPNSTGATS